MLPIIMSRKLSSLRRRSAGQADGILFCASMAVSVNPEFVLDQKLKKLYISQNGMYISKSTADGYAFAVFPDLATGMPKSPG